MISIPDSKRTLQQRHKTRNEKNSAQYFTYDERVVRKTHWTTQDEGN